METSSTDLGWIEQRGMNGGTPTIDDSGIMGAAIATPEAPSLAEALANGEWDATAPVTETLRSAWGLSPQERMTIIRRVTKDGLSIAAASKESGISESTVQRWVAQYRKEMSDRMSKARAGRGVVSPNRKKVLDAYAQNGSISEAARVVGVSYSIAHRWIRDAKSVENRTAKRETAKPAVNVRETAGLVTDEVTDTYPTTRGGVMFGWDTNEQLVARLNQAEKEVAELAVENYRLRKQLQARGQLQVRGS